MLAPTRTTTVAKTDSANPIAGRTAWGGGQCENSALDDLMRLMGASMSFDRDEEIYGEEEGAEFIYRVVRGAVRTHKLLNDGRRQIGAFYLPGDIFGLEAGDTHRLTAEAITDTTVVVLTRSALASRAARDVELARELWSLAARELEHMQDLMLALGRKNAQGRLAAFLLEMAGRVQRDNGIDLPMSRQDIADYLGLTIETVSRTLTQLEGSAVIELPSARRILLRNREALDRLNG